MSNKLFFRNKLGDKGVEVFAQAVSKIKDLSSLKLNLS